MTSMRFLVIFMMQTQDTHLTAEEHMVYLSDCRPLKCGHEEIQDDPTVIDNNLERV